MFKKLSPGSAFSSEGYSIKVGHHTLMYEKENGYTCNIEIEDEINPFRLVVYTKNLHYWSKPVQEIINEIEKQRLITHIDNALTFLKIKHVFE